MRDEKRPAPGATNTEDRRGNTLQDIPNTYSTTRTTGSQDILEFIPYGVAHAVTLSYLNRMTGIERRKLRKMIQHERLSGVPVVSGDTGYYIAETARERELFVRSMRHRAMEINAVADAVSRVRIGEEQPQPVSEGQPKGEG